MTRQVTQNSRNSLIPVIPMPANRQDSRLAPSANPPRGQIHAKSPPNSSTVAAARREVPAIPDKGRGKLSDDLPTRIRRTVKDDLVHKARRTVRHKASREMLERCMGRGWILAQLDNSMICGRVAHVNRIPLISQRVCRN